MGIGGNILRGTNGDDLRANRWKWYPTLALLGRVGLLDDEQQEMRLYNATGAEVTPEQPAEIAELLGPYLESLKPGSRLLLDLSVTTEPDDHHLRWKWYPFSLSFTQAHANGEQSQQYRDP